MLTGAIYFYIDLWTLGFPVDEKVWLDDTSDEENLLLDNIYVSREMAQKAGLALMDE